MSKQESWCRHGFARVTNGNRLVSTHTSLRAAKGHAPGEGEGVAVRRGPPRFGQWRVVARFRDGQWRDEPNNERALIREEP